jgi:hypothetical protein
MSRLIAVSICMASLALVACASTPTTPNQYGHHFNYEYQTPPQVSETDADECGKRANAAAFEATSKISDRAAIVFGPIGAGIQLARIRSKMNSTYEEVMKTCLREKGYVLEYAK